MNFFFKIKGFQQGQLFGLRSDLLPSTAFGIQRNSAFAVASYDFRSIGFSFGYNFSDYTKGMFANFSFHPIQYAAFQCEYLDNSFGIGLRTYYRGVELGVVYLHNLDNEEFIKEHAYWRIAYNFSSGNE